jgi:glycosyltransferase involved in cell wall biosynthesis
MVPRSFDVLINVPRGRHGGVANYYAGVRNKFDADVRYNYTGGHSGRKLLALCMVFDYIVFVAKLLWFRPDIVHVNPSLDMASTYREGVFLLLAKLFRRRVIVFWRGWEDSVAERITERHQAAFRRVYGRADAFIVLARDFAGALRSWGMEQPIYLETTQVDDDLLAGFRIEERVYAGRHILYMARVEADKGIFETLDAVAALEREGAELVVAGSGPAL